MKLGIINFHDMNIEKMQMFFDSKPGSFQPICGIIIANKSFSSAKAALVCSFRASGKNCRHLECRNVIHSRGCPVQNKGITLREKFYGTLIFQQSSMICIDRHVGGHTLALQRGG